MKKLAVNNLKYGTIIIDTVAFALIMCALTIDLFAIKAARGYPFSFDSKILSVFLPCIVAIITIPLSLMGEKVYGLTRAELNSLRGPWYFSPLHMILVLIALMVAPWLIELFQIKLELRVTEIIFSILSLFYSTYFLWCILPPICLNRRGIARIFRRYIDANHIDSKNISNHRLLLIGIQNFIIKEDIKNVYSFMTKNGDDLNTKTKLFESLLKSQLIYFEAFPRGFVYTNTVSLKMDIYMDSEAGYKNIKYALCSFDWDAVDEKECEEACGYLIKTTLLLHELNCFELEYENIREILYSKDSTLLKKYIARLVISTLRDKRFWFIDYLIDNYWFENDHDLLLFVCIFISYILTTDIYLDEQSKKLVSENVHSNKNHKQSKISLSELIKSFLEGNDSSNKTFSIKKVINIYDSIPDYMYWPSNNDGGELLNVAEIFNKNVIVEMYIKIIFCFRFGFSEKVFKRSLHNECNNEIREIISSLIGSGAFDQNGKCLDSFADCFEPEKLSDIKDFPKERLIQLLCDVIKPQC